MMTSVPREDNGSSILGPSLSRKSSHDYAVVCELGEEEEHDDGNVIWWSFLGLGVLNNLMYVLLLACAKDISEGGTALVFLANIVPGLVTKLSAPYWFPSVSYTARIRACTLLSINSLTLVALSSSVRYKLLGVALTSIQASLGEATLLALAGTYNHAITAFSTGTGWAGVIGFGCIVLAQQILHLPISTTLLFSNFFPLLYCAIYSQQFQHRFNNQNQVLEEVDDNEEEDHDPNKNILTNDNDHHDTKQDSISHTQKLTILENDDDEEEDHNGTMHSLEYQRRSSSLSYHDGLLYQVVENDSSKPNYSIREMTAKERLRLTLSFWPYAIPLALVYFSEYTLQSGTWTAMGMPNVYSEQNRVKFFTFANWSYQFGVCISRSSTLCIPILTMTWLWILPLVQLCNLIGFTILAAHTKDSSWPMYILLPICFYVGLLGGAVYVHGYSRIRNDMMPKSQELTEFALASISVADGFGISIANIVGLFVQSCLYQTYGLSSQAIVSCPLQ